MKLFSYIPSWLKNKYFLAGSFFIVWMICFDRNDFITQFQRFKHSRELNRQEKKQAQINNDTRKELDLLNTSDKTIEKYARENYKMKKDNEDLFIVSESN